MEVVPGEEVPAGDWQEASARCDHCGLRRRRRTTVLLRHSSGDVAQVGTACLEDFTGERDPLGSMAPHNTFEKATEASGSRDQPPEQTLQDFLAAVAAEARERGFVAKAEVSDPGQTTAERAARRLAGGRDVGRADRRLAGTVEHWVLHELANRWEQSPYDARLVSVFRRSERVGKRDRPMVASAWLAHERAGRAVRRAEHVSRWGPVFWHALCDERGRVLSWFAVGRRLEEGVRCRLRGGSAGTRGSAAAR